VDLFSSLTRVDSSDFYFEDQYIRYLLEELNIDMSHSSISQSNRIINDFVTHKEIIREKIKEQGKGSTDPRESEEESFTNDVQKLKNCEVYSENGHTQKGHSDIGTMVS